MDISELLGKTLINVQVDHVNHEIIFTTQDHEKYKLFHSQSCCESVTIDDINGDVNDLQFHPITLAEEVKNEDFEKQYAKTDEGKNAIEYDYSYTWTFYKLATIKGYVDIRWYGSSNGYYSESVDFVKADANGEFPYW